MVKGKTVDKWKMKSWYTIYAPDIFEGREIGKVPATEDKFLMGRVIKISLAEITGDISQSYSSVHFRVNGVKGKTASTLYMGHELSKGYLKTLVRRGRSILSLVQDVVTKDGAQVRVKSVILTARRVSTPVAKSIRATAFKEASDRAKEMTLSQLTQEILFGKFSSRLFNSVKRIAPIKRVEVRKTEVYVKEAKPEQ